MEYTDSCCIIWYYYPKEQATLFLITGYSPSPLCHIFSWVRTCV